jgi:hypothetical protein
MESKKRDKMVSVRIPKSLLDDIHHLNKLQRLNGNQYTISDTINIVLSKAKNDIKILNSNSLLFE